MKTALLIIDIQNDYFPGGQNELTGSIEASVATKEMLQHFRDRSLPIIHVQHVSTRPGATFFIPDTPGVEFHENVKPILNEKVIIKNYPNSFRNTVLHDYLQQKAITELVIAGMMTHMCIDTTVRAAYDLGYKCILAGDCCATKDLKLSDKMISASDVHHSFLAALNGIFCNVLNKDKIIESIVSSIYI